MTITAKVIADSISPQGHRLTTMQLRYPRFIHAEFMTHRVFSRNASSSRAVPVERMIQDVLDDPATPVEWGSNKPGMQAGDELTGGDRNEAINTWLEASEYAAYKANNLMKLGLHKQIANRLLEPFAHISVVCTATEWDNFFALRCHPAADPTMRALAEAMRDAREASVPVPLKHGEWHLPYVVAKDLSFIEKPARFDLSYDEMGDYIHKRLAMISAARCARVSYLNHDGSNPDVEKDLALAKRLLESRHMSPSEHQARVTGDEGTALWGNFTGWDQHRKMIEARQ